jgi:hypothetical protein
MKTGFRLLLFILIIRCTIIPLKGEYASAMAITFDGRHVLAAMEYSREIVAFKLMHQVLELSQLVD